MFNLDTLGDSVYSHQSRKRLAGILGSLLLTTALMVGAIPTAHAQVLFGSIVGTVTDATGGAVPAAVVTVTETQTNDSRETKTSDTGSFTLSTVRAGTYKVSVAKSGFKTYTINNIPVSANTVVRVDAGLEIGTQTQTVEVSAIAAPLQTDKADVHLEFNTKQIVDLPSATRQFGGLAALVPGISVPGASGGGNNNPAKSFQITADGTSRSGTNTMIDGVSAVNPWVQSNSVYAPSVEALEAVSIVTASSGADQANTNGASINLQTKSGSNDIHGAAFEYNVDAAFKSRPFFLAANQNKPKYVNNDFGGNVGGKIIKNKLFYFGSYERESIYSGSANSGITIPWAPIRTGDMSAGLTLPANLGGPTTIYDPNTGGLDAKGNPAGRSPFPNNVIPSNRISAVSKAMVALLPQPNQNLTSILPSNNFYANVPQANLLGHIDTKFDWVATEKLKITGRYGYMPYEINQPTVFGDVLGGTANQKYQKGYSNAFAVAASYVWTPNLVTDINWGRTYAHQTYLPASADQRIGLDVFHIPGSNQGALPYGGSLPQININNYSGYGMSFTPLQYDDPVYQYTANTTWTKKSHNIRFGMNISHQHMAHYETQPVPGFNFAGNLTTKGSDGVNPNAFNTYADFLLGQAYRIINTLPTTKPIEMFTNQYSFYLQDSWQVSRKLTVNVGTAWEYYPIPTRGDRQIETWDFSSNKIILCGQGSIASNCGITVQKTLFAPRVGFAFRPTESLVIRAGYSLAPEQINMFRDGIYNFPARLTYDQTASSTWSSIGSFDTGLPTPPPAVINNGVVTPPPGTLLGAIIPQNQLFKRGYTESENLSIQKDFGHGWVGQVGYVGTLTIHQHTRYDINYGTLNGGNASKQFANVGITSGMVVILPYETMRYNSLQAQLNHRFSKGFLFGAAFTHEKWIGLCCDDSGDGQPAITLPGYTNLNRALMNADRPNNLRISSTYDLPFGKGQQMLATGAGAHILGGWHLNGVFSAYSGAPFSASGGNINTPGFTQRAQQVNTEVKKFGNIGNGQLYFDTSAFVAAPNGVIGNAGYNTLRGPGVVNVDFSIFRDFKPTERIVLQFRAEALNATNTPHFSNPGGNVTAPNYGQVTGVSAPTRLIDERYLRFGLKIKF